MWYSRMTLAAVLICLLAGCTKSNPLIGKWKLAPKAARLRNVRWNQVFRENHDSECSWQADGASHLWPRRGSLSRQRAKRHDGV
jgi:hypothetical protein